MYNFATCGFLWVWNGKLPSTSKKKFYIYIYITVTTWFSITYWFEVTICHNLSLSMPQNGKQCWNTLKYEDARSFKNMLLNLKNYRLCYTIHKNYLMRFCTIHETEHQICHISLSMFLDEGPCILLKKKTEYLYTHLQYFQWQTVEY